MPCSGKGRLEPSCDMDRRLGGGGGGGVDLAARAGGAAHAWRAWRARRARRAWVFIVRIPDYMWWLYSTLRSEKAHGGHAYYGSLARIYLVACLGSVCCWSRIEIPIITCSVHNIGNPCYHKFFPLFSCFRLATILVVVQIGRARHRSMRLVKPLR
jgi:hypothetical protein